MTIRIWQSYSCNNSSSYYLIARFTDVDSAEDAANELEEFFAVHAAELDARETYTDTPSEASRALAAKYGFEWKRCLTWGDAELVGDEPDVILDGEILIVHHGYCGGFRDGVPEYLTRRGAHVGRQNDGDIEMSLLFRAPQGAAPALEAELVEMFGQLHEEDGTSGEVEPLVAPWDMGHESYGTFTYFRDAGTVGLHFPIDPRDIANLRAWIEKHQIDRPVIELDQSANQATFAAIAKARCTACTGPVEYLDPRLHDIETPQLVCRPCGGFYELSAFVQEAK